MQLNGEIGQLKLQRNYDYSKLKYIKYIKIHEFKMTKKKKKKTTPSATITGCWKTNSSFQK